MAISHNHYTDWKNGFGRKVKYHPRLAPIVDDLERSKGRNFHLLSIYNRIFSLKNTGYFSSLRSRVQSQRYQLTFEGGEIRYHIHGGTIYIDHLVRATEAYELRRAEKTASGFYAVNWVGDNEFDPAKPKWKVGDACDSIAQTGVAHSGLHAAVNGEAADAQTAANIMPPHVDKGHKLRPGELSAAGFTFFYAPSSVGEDGAWQGVVSSQYWAREGQKSARKARLATADLAHRLAAAIEQSGQHKVNWTVHSSGMPVFLAALKLLVSRRVSLDSHSVHFSNAFSNMVAAGSLLEQTGMQAALGGLYAINPHSLRQTVSSGNMVGIPWYELKTHGWEGFEKATAPLGGGALSLGLVGVGITSGITSLVTTGSIMAGIGLARQLPQTPKRLAQARLFAANFSTQGRRALDQVSYDDPLKALKAMQGVRKRA